MGNPSGPLQDAQRAPQATECRYEVIALFRVKGAGQRERSQQLERVAEMLAGRLVGCLAHDSTASIQRAAPLAPVASVHDPAALGPRIGHHLASAVAATVQPAATIGEQPSAR